MKSTSITSRAVAILSIVATATARRCQNLTVEVSLEARNGVFSLPPPTTNIAATDFAVNLAQDGVNYTAQVLTGYATVKGKYSIAATYCEPDSGPSKTLQLLTHGLGFDRSYWDLSADGFNYSYTAVANAKYSTFSYDRLGIGHSQHGDPINEIQAQLELDVLYKLTEKLQQGAISGVKRKYPSIIHVGHSFGSQLTYALAARYPTLSAGLVLTGFSHDPSGLPGFVLGSNFVHNPIAGFAPGYIAPGDASAVQNGFFAPGQFDPAILAYAIATGQPIAPGELLTNVPLVSSVSPFAGPVLVITGNRDVPFCAGNCDYTGDASIPNKLAISAQLLPKASKFQAIIVPDAGHGLNLEYSCSSTYKSMLDFVAATTGSYTREL